MREPLITELRACSSRRLEQAMARLLLGHSGARSFDQTRATSCRWRASVVTKDGRACSARVRGFQAGSGQELHVATEPQRRIPAGPSIPTPLSMVIPQADATG